ncbi:protein NYNRIN-like [Grus japonensis]
MLQYVDDILLAAETWEECIQMTISLLNFLGQGGYKVAKKAAQIAKPMVTYLGFEILQGQRRLGTDRKEAICQIPEPKTARDLRAFLGTAGWCRLWISNYGLLVRPLYDILKEAQGEYLPWNPECGRPFGA